jgi:hypothetical protein
MHDYIARAYEKACEDAGRVAELMPPYVPPVLTRKQKVERKIAYRKRLLGKVLYKISNRLGYYDDSY